MCYLLDVVARKEATNVKILGESNPADLMTKYLTGKRTGELKEMMGIQREAGRHRLASKCAEDAMQDPLEGETLGTEECELQEEFF